MWSVTVASVHTPRQRNIPYGKTVRRSIYKTRLPEHHHFLILPYTRLPWYPIHIPLTWNTDQTQPGSMLCLLIHLWSRNLLRRHNRRKHSAAASRSPPYMHQVSNYSSVIGIGISALATVSYLTRLDLPFLTWFNSPFYTVFDSSFLTGFDSVFYMIQITFDLFIFNLSLLSHVPVKL